MKTLLPCELSPQSPSLSFIRQFYVKQELCGLRRMETEIRRRTRVVGAFPDGSSCLNLAAARLQHIAGTQWSTRCYMNMARLKEAKIATYGAAVA